MPFKPTVANHFHDQRRLICSYNSLTSYLARPFTALKVYINALKADMNFLKAYKNELAHLREQLQQHVDTNDRLIEQLVETKQSKARLEANLKHDQQEHQRQLRDISSALKSESERRETTEMDLRTLQRGCKTRTDQKNTAIKRASDLEHNVAVLQDSKRRLETDVKNLEEKSTERELKLKETTDRLSIVEVRAKKTEDKVREELQSPYEQQIYKLERDLGNTKAELAEATKDKESYRQELEHSEKARKAKETELAIVQAENERLQSYVLKAKEAETQLTESRFENHGLRRAKRLAWNEVDYVRGRAQKECDDVNEWARKWQAHCLGILFKSWNQYPSPGSDSRKKTSTKAASANKKADDRGASSTASDSRKKTSTKAASANKKADDRGASSTASDGRKKAPAAEGPDSNVDPHAASDRTRPDLSSTHRYLNHFYGPRYSLTSRQIITKDDTEVDGLLPKLPDAPVDDYTDPLPPSEIDALCTRFSGLSLDDEPEALRILRMLKAFDPSLSFPSLGGNSPSAASVGPSMPLGC